MKFIRRFIYLGYYFKQLDWQRLRRFMRFVYQRDGVSFARQWVLMMGNSLRYNISLLEFYQFGFIAQTPAQKATWAGTGTMYEFQRRANPPGSRDLLADKGRFYEAYRPYFRHEVCSLAALQRDPALAARLLERHKHLVFKPARGNCGVGIAFVESRTLSADGLIPWMRSRNFDLVESRVAQHPALQGLSPSGVNTVRIFTCLNEQDRCRILGCRLRISVNSPVDNMAAGNLAAPVEEATGRVCGPGVYSDITRAPESVHPVSGVAIKGFQIPYWPETLSLVRGVSELHPQNRSVGWDIVITPEGPGLIEGNHDWCKLVWQLPVGRGLKHLLDQCATHG